MSETTDASTTATTQNTSSVVESPPTERSSWTRYIIYAIAIILVITLVYFAYDTFISNSEKQIGDAETCDSDDTISGFNLRESIQDLQDAQSKILQTLSTDYD